MSASRAKSAPKGTRTGGNRRRSWKESRQAAYEAWLAERTKEITLRARVEWPNTPLAMISPARAAALCDVDERTIRRLVHLGLPRYGTEREARFNPREVVIWYICYKTTSAKQRPEHLTMEHAEREHLRHQWKQNPRGYVLVPLDPLHPMREELLRRAAAGDLAVYPTWEEVAAAEADTLDDEPYPEDAEPDE